MQLSNRHNERAGMFLLERGEGVDGMYHNVSTTREPICVLNLCTRVNTSKLGAAVQ